MRTLRSAIPHSCSSCFFFLLPFLSFMFSYKIKPGLGGLPSYLRLSDCSGGAALQEGALLSSPLPLLSLLLSFPLPFLLSFSPSAGHCPGFLALCCPLHFSPLPSSSYVGIVARLKQFPRPHIAFVCPHGWDQRCPMVVGGFAVAVGRVRRDAQFSDRGCLLAFIWIC